MDDNLIEEILLKLDLLQISQNELRAELRAQRARRNNNVYAVHDRVEILNRVHRPKHWTGPWTPELAQQSQYAIVTRVNGDRVSVLTDIGIRTWRAPQNLRRIR
jgi:hypothetical protein